jgi:TRAP-type C4-dicarboxylate transport system substrate-binding protein
LKRLLETIGKSINNRLTRRACCLFCFLAVAAMLPAASAYAENKPEFEIKLATLAPENSSLMQVFNEMNAEVLRETGGKVGFKMFAGFVMGDEEDVLRKLRVGLVHAAVFTATALTDMDPALRSLQIPFLFSNYGEVDYVMEKMEPDFRAALLKEGYEVLGWPELGFLYFMSTSPIAGLEDLKGKKVWAKANMPMSQAMIDRAGVSTVAIGLPDVLVALQTHLLDVVYNSPYYALVTQWNTQVKYFTDLPLSYIGGALLVDRKIMAKMPAPLQETVRKVCAAHLQRLNEKTRKDNEDAIQIILKRGVQKVTPDAAHVKGFKDLSDEAMAGLDAKFLPPTAVSKVRAALAEYRAQHPSKP